MIYISRMVTQKIRATGGNPILHRLQIGLAGLFAVLVMVALADMLLQRADGGSAANATVVGPVDPADPAAPPVVSAPAASEPLVDLGVVPDLPNDAKARQHSASVPVVGELQPNPDTAAAQPTRQ
ncbi:hypothetical protein [Blastomonas sp.]|uniref:hypothetical protein n=1 Tax=Blastomonas sp. TaxID=1909299 RepID=UPI003593F86E